MPSDVNPLEQIEDLLGQIECLIASENPVAPPPASLDTPLDKSAAVRGSVRELGDCLNRLKTAVEQARCRWNRINDEQLRLAKAQADAIVNSAQIIQQLEETQEELQRVQREKLDIARRAGMAEVAIGVLHNVGNVLNSVNVSARLVTETVEKSCVAGLAKANALIDRHADDLGTFIMNDERGKRLPEYLRELSKQLHRERDSVLEELGILMQNAEHIKDIVSMQQSYATTSGVTIPASLAGLVEDAMKANDASFLRHNVDVVREYEELPQVTTDRHKVLQVLVNLISNAKHALSASDTEERRLTVRVVRSGEDLVTVEVEDNGVGIPSENLTRVFQHGFTMKKDGHGFGLHSSALAAKELGGSLTAHSDGPGCGACFCLELPMTVEEKTLCTA